ncbi:tyrosine-type recombinase/integrase [Saccharopolyspora hattusasensis]|uniref:tyrosine-type recombinase/integrase n=1 Tax=Saccharopolyspora hattusasensis TaxID=1128679 RepID=UPI003D9988EE
MSGRQSFRILRVGDRKPFPGKCLSAPMRLCAYAPHGPMSRNTISNVVARAARRAGLPVMYAHRLRHSAATAMLTAGASLAEIGQVLRHRDPITTALYAKVDVGALRQVARRWPASESVA